MKKFSIIAGLCCTVAIAYFASMSFQVTAPPPVVNHFQDDDNLSIITMDTAALGTVAAEGKLAKSLNNPRLNNVGEDVEYLNDADPGNFIKTNAAKGHIAFGKSTKKYEGAFKPQLLDTKSAQNVAEKFLQDNDLMPKNKSELKLLHAGGLRAASADDGGKVIDKMQTFTYGRVINGVPVSGNGSRIVVNMGDKGEVLGVSKKWKEFETSKSQKVQKAELKSQPEAEAEFGKLVNFNFGKGASPKVKTIHKMYYDGGGNYIQPAYFFETTVTVTDEKGKKSEQPFLGVVSMLKNSPEAINPDPAEVAKIAKSVRTAQEGVDPNTQKKANERAGNENK